MKAIPIIASLFVLFTACSESPSDAQPEFECVGECVGDLALSLPNGRLHDGPLPTATTRGDEPVVISSDWVPVSKGVFALELFIESAAPITVVYLEINGSIYAIDPAPFAGPSLAVIDGCELLVEQQGYGCTEACIDACSCVTCNTSSERSMVIDACAVNCSIYDNQGSIGPEPYTSEAVFAELLYNGQPDSGLPGMLQSRTDCSGQVCSNRAAASRRNDQRVRLAFAYQDDSFLDDLNVGTLVAQANTPDDTPSTGSPAGAPAKLSIKGNGCIQY